MTPRELVERFYAVIWNQGDEAAARKIIAADFVFRGSLGLEKRGFDAFVGYLRMVRTALSGYTCDIEDLVVSDGRAAARMRFSGEHTGSFLGFAPTGRPVSWAGAAFFRMNDRQILETWVLGDLDGLKRQLRG